MATQFMKIAEGNGTPLSVYRFAFRLRAVERIEFGVQVGAQIRGALFHALRSQACAATREEHDQRHAELCPVCWLMAREAPDAARGKDVPRPFTIQPPSFPINGTLQIPAGTTFTTGITLFGPALKLFPYLVQAFPYAGEQGIGYRRGRFSLEAIEAVHPLTGQCQYLLEPGSTTVQGLPPWGINQQAISNHAEQLGCDSLRLRYLTPTRLIDNGRLVKTPVFRVLVARLLERFDLLNREYGIWESVSPYRALVDQARQVQIVRTDIKWVEVFSGSRRLNRATPISGFVGEVEYQGALAPFREWLLWGQCIQVGKDTVKGNGLYEVDRHSVSQ